MNQLSKINTKVCVSTQEYFYDSYHSDEEYGEWSEDNEVIGVYLPNDDFFSRELFDLGEPVSVGDIVYVVSIVYQNGDSFGRSTGNGELVWVFKDENLAYLASNEIYKNQEEYSIKIQVGENRVISWSNPAAGYFEHLTTVNVDEFIVEE